MQFFATITLAISAMASLSAAASIPTDIKRDESAPALNARVPQEGAGDASTNFPDRFCASGFASCGKAGTDGGPGNRCALACENFAGGVALGFCDCPTGMFPDECIDLTRYNGRHKCR